MMAGTEEFISQMACTLCVKQPSLLYFLFSLESPACVRSAAQQSLGLCLCTAFERMIHLRTWPYLAEGDSRVPVFFFFFIVFLFFSFMSAWAECPWNCGHNYWTLGCYIWQCISDLGCVLSCWPQLHSVGCSLVFQLLPCVCERYSWAACCKYALSLYPDSPFHRPDTCRALIICSMSERVYIVCVRPTSWWLCWDLCESSREWLNSGVSYSLVCVSEFSELAFCVCDRKTISRLLHSACGGV